MTIDNPIASPTANPVATPTANPTADPTAAAAKFHPHSGLGDKGGSPCCDTSACNSQERADSRTERLIGPNACRKLTQSKVAVFGVGGVGGMAMEALARSGVGNLILVDADTVALSNLNRQIIATEATLGQAKVAVAQTRIAQINPQINVVTRQIFIRPTTELNFIDDVNFVLDCIDTVSAKIHLIEYCLGNGIPIISAMGAGNRLDPSKMGISDISKTYNCRLAKVMRTELRHRGIRHLPVVFSSEVPLRTPAVDGKRMPPASMIFVPATAGLLMANYVLSALIKN